MKTRVIQEIVLAKDPLLLFGDRIVKWDKFESAFTYHLTRIRSTTTSSLTMHAGLDFREAYNRVSHLTWSKRERKFHDLSRKNNLLDLLVKFISSRSVDQRDKIYSLRAVATDGIKFGVDYHKAITAVIFNALSICEPVLQFYEDTCGKYSSGTQLGSIHRRCDAFEYGNIVYSNLRISDRLMETFVKSARHPSQVVWLRCSLSMSDYLFDETHRKERKLVFMQRYESKLNGIAGKSTFSNHAVYQLEAIDEWIKFPRVCFS